MALFLIIAGVLAVWAFFGVTAIALCVAAARGDRDQEATAGQPELRLTRVHTLPGRTRSAPGTWTQAGR